MKVLEIMERVGSRNTNLIITYIKDALEEIQEQSVDARSREVYNIQKNVKFYPFPADFVRLLGVYRKVNSSGKYERIDRVIKNPIIEDLSRYPSVYEGIAVSESVTVQIV